MTFTTSGVKEATTSYLKPGVNHNVTIAGIEGVTPAQGSPYIEINFHKTGVAPEFGTKVRFYMSEKGMPSSMTKIKHIGTKVVKAAILDGIKADTLSEYATKLNSVLSGKTLRMKFTGEEYKNSKDELKVKTTLGLPPFAEAITDVAEEAKISDENTSLKYDPTNQYDLKKLTKLEETPSAGDSTESVEW